MKFSLLALLPISLVLSILPFFKEISWSLLTLNLFILAIFSFTKYSLTNHRYLFSNPSSKNLLARNSISKYLFTPKIINTSLVIINLLLIVKVYGFHITQEVSISLLISMLCLKLLEIKDQHDYRNITIVIHLQFFLLSCAFLSSQGLGITLYSILVILFLLLLMMLMTHSPIFINKLNLLPLFKIRLFFQTNLKIISLAVPITLVLFILFPRIPGPLWTLPNLASSGTTGLSDSMYPGSVNNLSDSSEIVFRIDFKKDIPQASELYWRGPVLSQTDGFLWQQDKNSSKKLKGKFSQRITQAENNINYTITLEPQKQKWLFSLEMGESISSQFVSDAYLSNNMQFLVKHVISRVVQYQVSSYTSFIFNSSSQAEIQQALIYPQGSNPKTLQLGKQWQQSAEQTGAQPAAIVKKALDYYVNQNFYYTRQPSIMVDNPSDEFLFQYKRGFCEHFASSFVLLMRAANIPARVVTGYQGMEHNKLGNYYLVRQSDAHAWAEVWLKDKGWIRVDPTAIIPQDHIKNDIFDYKNNEFGFLNLNYSDLHQLSQSLKQQFWTEKLARQFKQSIDVIQYSWNNWVLGYDQNKQRSFLALFGIKNQWQTLILLLTIIPLLIIAIFFYFNLIKKQKNSDKLVLLYQQLLYKLKKSGLKYSIHDGPENIKNKSLLQFPKQKAQLEYIFDYYIQLRYAKASKNYSYKQFKFLLKQIKFPKFNK
ncbi:MAG: DUF3488 and transglutaminase-like domain-containing protein [Pseudomonadota bacterium]